MPSVEIEKPCPSCLVLYERGQIRRETIQPLRGGGLDARNLKGESHCEDCSLAWTLERLTTVPTILAGRIATGNHRQESMRLPGLVMGLSLSHRARVSVEGELDSHHRWLDVMVPELEE